MMRIHPPIFRKLRSGSGRRACADGFTLIELIMVVVIMGVLAVFAAPRLFNTGDFNARGFHDETLALLRFGQKSAVAQRRTVCVTLNVNGVSMKMFVANPAPTTCAAATPAQAPDLVLPFAPRGGSGLSSSLGVPFQFTPLGGTDQNSAVTISIANSTPITVEASTGYVHD
jgi:MSHA pilin protein MshC